MRKILYMVLSIIVLIGCSAENSETQTEVPEGVKQIKVEEHMNSKGYTYIKGNENGKEIWIAVREMPVETGEIYYYSEGMAMSDFKSETLGKTFETIYFVDAISKTPASDVKMESSKGMTNMPASNMGHGKPEVKAVEDIKVMPLSGGMTVAGINKNKSSLDGKTVKVRGVVTKFNGGIMKRNWIHIQDGTNHEGSVDVTVTSDQPAKVGETVVIEGTLAVDKDFGAGYFYDVIIENATVTVEDKIKS